MLLDGIVFVSKIELTQENIRRYQTWQKTWDAHAPLKHKKTVLANTMTDNASSLTLNFKQNGAFASSSGVCFFISRHISNIKYLYFMTLMT